MSMTISAEQKCAAGTYHHAMVFLAMSCLQGRPMRTAFDELRPLADGVQLTPGNVPTAGFRAHVAARAAAGTKVRAHHGFSFEARKREVWAADGQCRVAVESVHPPTSDHPAALHFLERLEELPASVVLETMYPGYCLGDDDSIARAIDLQRRLAVDVSHVFLALIAGTMTKRTWQRLQEYEHVVELHVSANDGRSDAHRPLAHDTFGLDWARARARAGTPLVLECYFHRLDGDERRRQVELARG
jgi:hypothetical protein